MKLLMACLAIAISFISSSAAFAKEPATQMTILLERIYVDGEVSEEIKQETITSMKDIWKKYEGWQLVNLDDEQIVFQKMVQDISPLSKANGYFGLTKDGTLSIFEGKPGKSSRVIQSFFQLDIKKLESHQQERLKKGIRVISKDRYKEVIEAYRPFAVTQ
ncbi:Forespore regulator of the sigma-K checkpoint, BofC [Anoxybacillus sp. UARK-01]|uniref:intercompartmental signaling factor BofC n=1 Tax=Anoxybacillus sp. UARK-01 TaxID=1895648 RepID=UPI0009B9CC5F|nr:Forespore regulator of the sigma-K checkpoint, BofC [Anoxybacillus sp. UARK-01]